MPSNKETKTVEEPPKSALPTWITEEYFKNIVTNDVKDFKKIVKFNPEIGTTAGENYASVMVRVLIEAECKDGSIQELSYVMKTGHETGSAASQMVKEMGIFDKEISVYDDIIPVFEKLYADKGKKVTFGPRSYKLDKDPSAEVVVLEDLRTRKFKNADRLAGLDMDHCKAVLKVLAQFHAASAVRFETNGPYSKSFILGMFDPEKRHLFEEMYGGLMAVMRKCFSENMEDGPYYAKKLFPTETKELIDKMMKLGDINPNEFNVLNHGDCWCNNIMFKYNDSEEIEETLLVDFQISKYGSPAQDLYYFLFSSARQDIKLKHFDYFIKYYYDNLVENLKFLDYSKPVPKLIDIHTALLKHSYWAVMTLSGVMAAVLLDPTEMASIDNFIGESKEAKTFQTLMYSSTRYVKAANSILPWIDNRGILD